MSRIPLDAYYTDPVLARCLVSTLRPEQKAMRGTHWLEPSAGGAAFVDAWHEQAEAANLMTALDINPEAPGLRRDYVRGHVGDFLKLRGTKQPVDVVVGNPPYARGTGRFNEKGDEIMEPIAEAHVRKALSIVRPGGLVACLLRLAFSESKERVPFWDQFPARKVWALAERPSFTGGKTDNCAYGWFVWQRGWTGKTEFVPGWSWHRVARENGWRAA